MARLLAEEEIVNARLHSIDELKAKGLWFDSWEEREKERKKIDFLRNLYLKTKEEHFSEDMLTEDERSFLQAFPNIDLRATYVAEEEKYFTILRHMAQHDITAYHEYMNPQEIPAKHHRFICNYMQKIESRELKLLLLSMPPGSAKSTYASRSFVQWYMGRNPTHKILSAGYNINFVVQEFSRPNKQAIDSDDYKAIFPDIELDPTYRSSQLWGLLKYKGRYTVRSVGASTSGIRANLIVLDDIIGGADSALSDKEREKAIQWLTADVFPRMLPGAAILMIGTRWHSDDPMGFVERMLHEKSEAMPHPFEIINIPVECGPENPICQEEGHFLWEEFYGREHFINIKTTMNPLLWSATYLGKPIDNVGEYLKYEDIQQYDKLPEGQGIVTLSVDTAQKSTLGANRTAIVAVKRFENDVHYIVDAWAGQKPMHEIITVIGNMAKAHGASRILIEDAAMGTQIIENYSHSFPCPVIPIKPQNKGTKEFNFETYALPWILSNKLVFPKSALWLPDLVEEILAFPHGKYDDFVDALSQYCRYNTKHRKYGAKPLKLVY